VLTGTVVPTPTSAGSPGLTLENHMHIRSVLTALTTTALLSLTASAAPAATTEFVDKSIFDATPEVTASSLQLEGETSGDLGGYLSLKAVAVDGTLPTVFGTCEPVRVQAVLTLPTGETIAVRTRGEACAHIVDGTLQVVAGFDRHDVAGRPWKKPRVIGEGLLSAAVHPYGGQAQFSAQIRH
jgi:hypothetical protein